MCFLQRELVVVLCWEREGRARFYVVTAGQRTAMAASVSRSPAQLSQHYC